MSTPSSSSLGSVATLGLTALILLPSCSLPPGVAWRQIRQDGLIAFVNNGMSAPKAISPDQAPAASGTMLAQNQPSQSKVVVPVQPKVQQPVPTFLVAHSVPNLKGYVRTPYTNPPRLVDVRGQAAGAKMVCPYTQKPFVIPAESAAPSTPPKTMLASSPSKPAPAPQVKAQPSPAPASKSLDQAPTPKLLATTPPAAPPKPQPAPAASASTPPAPAPKTTPPPLVKTEPQKELAPTVAANTKPAPEPAPKIEPKKEPAPAPQAAAPKLPFGSPIPGRPGFVNSPYAEKHQLVDVTGLAVGTEVKCPYTGKLFRVPPQAQAKR